MLLHLKKTFRRAQKQTFSLRIPLGALAGVTFPSRLGGILIVSFEKDGCISQ